MEPDPCEINESTKDQEEREHLEGIERERQGLAYSKEEHLQNLRIMRELDLEAHRAIRVYGNYTLTSLVFGRELVLEKQPEWNSVMRHVYHQASCESIVWGRDIGCPERVLLLFEWSTDTSESHTLDMSVWEVLMPLLKSKPQSWQIALNPPGLFKSTSREGELLIKEFMIIEGRDEIFNPPDPLNLLDLQALETRTVSHIGHDPPVDFAGFYQGITSSINGERTITIILDWVSEDKRSSFVDPKQLAGKDHYETCIAIPLRKLEQAGARSQSYMCYMKGWHPPDEPKQNKQCCTMM